MQDSLCRHFEELHSATSKPFSVILHGDVRPDNISFTPAERPGDDPKEAKLSTLRASMVGSPLLDIYMVFFNCADPFTRAMDPQDFLSPYFDAFVDVSSHLRVRMNDFHLDTLVSDFKTYELAGALCVAAATGEPPSPSVPIKHCLAIKMKNLSLDIPNETPSIN